MSALLDLKYPQVKRHPDQQYRRKTIEDQIVVHQVLQDIKRLITFLPDSQREVLVMRYYQNLSFKEIADKTGVSINTALGRMRYAILNMRRLAQEHKIELAV